MKIWIDCEFNSSQGELISLALVADDGREFYEVLDCDNPEPWVAEHVMPVLGELPIPKAEFQAKLQEFLQQFHTVHIVADWPEDISHFMRALITGPGTRLDTPALTAEVLRVDAPSDLPHNALADARGIRDYVRARQRPGDDDLCGFAVFASYGGGQTRLPGYEGSSIEEVERQVLARAWREGYQGTVRDRMKELGWWVAPIYARPQVQETTP